MKFCMTVQENVTLHTGDCLIEVTTWEGWTVLHFNIDNMIYVLLNLIVVSLSTDI